MAGRYFHGPFLRAAGFEVVGATTTNPERIGHLKEDFPNAIAYENVSKVLHNLNEDIAVYASDVRSLDEIQGIGESIAKKIIEYFENKSTPIKISLIVCNVPGAGVLEIAKSKGIPTLLINKTEFATTGYVESLHNADIHFIVLAGFLWKVPAVLVKAFQPSSNTKGIINIHPALLPKYGGKGMYGAHVHEAVIAAGEAESGITIHWVNEHYDEGAIIFQATCKIENGDTPDMLANKIHALEHAHFAPTIEKLLS